MSSSYNRYSDTHDEDMSIAQSDAEVSGRISGAPFWNSRELSDGYTGTEVKRGSVDVPFLLLTLLILLVGVIMVLSASYARGYYVSGEPLRIFTRQLVFAVSGVAIMLLVSRITVRFISRFANVLFVIALFMLVAVLYVGNEVNGAKRWLGFEGGGGSFSFQPSEIAKLALIIAFSKWMCAKGQRKMGTLMYGVIPFIIVLAVLVVLLMREPHISASITVIMLTAIMMFAGGTRLRWFVLAILAVAAVAGFLLHPYFKNPAQELNSQTLTEHISQVQWGGEKLGYADGRIDAWLNPDADPLGKGFQIRQSLFAVGSGGLLGEGLGKSRQKYLYLPEEHNDYIFAIVCEELGYIGAMLILMLFALLIIRGFWLALNAKDKYSSLITIGITSLLSIQVFLNVAVVTNILPATGVSLPFFSYGGTALWIQLFQVGIILAVSREIPHKVIRKTNREVEIAA